MNSPTKPKRLRTRLILDQAIANVMNHRSPRTNSRNFARFRPPAHGQHRVFIAA